MYSQLTFACLFLSVVLLWSPARQLRYLWLMTAIPALICGYYAHHIDLYGLGWVGLLAAMCILLQQIKISSVGGILLCLGITGLSVAIGMHVLPGFHNLKVIDHAQISAAAIPYTLYWNIDQTCVGLILLGFTHARINSRKEFTAMLPTTLLLSCITIATTLALAYYFGTVHFEPKFPAQFFLWSATNLLLVCPAEEALFRGFIQKHLAHSWRNISGGWILAIIIASVLFGAKHYAGGPTYIILASVAGLGYGLVYSLTKRIEASILCHFLLNLAHFTLFTYPALAATT